MVVDQRLAQLPGDRAMVGSNLAASIVSSWESAVFLFAVSLGFAAYPRA